MKSDRGAPSAKGIEDQPSPAADVSSREPGAAKPLSEPSHFGTLPTPSPIQPGNQRFWLWVMCLTGVDYFSTLGYQPSIAFNATGLLAPIATIVLVLVTMLGALPVYAHVAASSPNGQGSIGMLERLVHGWTGKIMVLVLLGFAATDFVITKTLSAADAAVHIMGNPFWLAHTPDVLRSLSMDGQRMAITMLLLVILSASFMRGFKEVIGLAVVIVSIYLLLNLFVIGSGLVYLLVHPQLIEHWYENLVQGNWHIKSAPAIGHSWWAIIAVCLIYFPKLALGLSGFETGVAVMPLIKGDPHDRPDRPTGRIRNTRKLLFTAAALMSCYLLGSAMVSATLIPYQALTSPDTFEARGEPVPVGAGVAADRALAYLAHADGPYNINPLFGHAFGTLYDLSTIVILCFAGMSAMAGLLNLVPQYLPRYGMAPEWTRAIRPLVLLFTMVNLLVTWVFRAGVERQSGAYATGVLVLISSACMATVIDHWRERPEAGWIRRLSWPYVLIMLIFFYTTGANMVERPDGIKIASWFILAILVSSFGSRLKRSTELRFKAFEFANAQSKFLWDSLKHLEFPVLVPHRPGRRELDVKEASIRRRHRIPPEVPIVFIEAELGDPSEFQQSPLMEILQEGGRFIISVKRCASIAHVIAAIALELSRTGKPPEIHFGWSDESPLAASIGFFLFGVGNVPSRVQDLLRKAEPDPHRRPEVIVG